MENAGRGCAELLMRLNPEHKPTVILCGPGNNGGDGFVIARHLDNHGWPVKLEIVARHNKTPGDADVNFDILYASGIEFNQFRPDYVEQSHREMILRDLSKAEFLVDAMFGTGLTRPLADPFAWLADTLNQTNKPILAVDIPAGLDCDTGEPLGPTVRATHTATFVAHKKGFLNPKSREWTGEVHVIDIGAPRVLVDEYRSRRLG
jgi:NAD(P)H-hydrate epimerase